MVLACVGRSSLVVLSYVGLRYVIYVFEGKALSCWTVNMLDLHVPWYLGTKLPAGTLPPVCMTAAVFPRIDLAYG